MVGGREYYCTGNRHIVHFNNSVLGGNFSSTHHDARQLTPSDTNTHNERAYRYTTNEPIHTLR